MRSRSKATVDDITNMLRVIRVTFSFNFSRNIVALPVKKRCCPYYIPLVLNLPRNKFQCFKLEKLLQIVELRSTLRNILSQIATLKFVA